MCQESNLVLAFLGSLYGQTESETFAEADFLLCLLVWENIDEVAIACDLQTNRLSLLLEGFEIDVGLVTCFSVVLEHW